MDCSPGSVHGISQAKILEQIAILMPGVLPDTGIEPAALACLALADRFFTTAPPGKPIPLETPLKKPFGGGRHI